MGCGASLELRSKQEFENSTLQTPLDIKIYILDDEAYSEDFAKLKSFVQSVEELRHTIIDELDYISIITGNCSHLTLGLSLLECIRKVGWKLAVDNKGDINKCGLSVNEKEHPKVKLNSKNNSKEVIESCNYIFNYLYKLEKMKDKIEEVENNRKRIDTLLNNSKTLLKSYSNNKTKELEKVMLIRNIEHANSAISIIEDLKNKLKDNIKQINDGVKLLQDKNEIEEFNKRSLLAIKARLKIPHLLVWHCLDKEMRYKGSSDGYFHFNERIVFKKKLKEKYKLNMNID